MKNLTNHFKKHFSQTVINCAAKFKSVPMIHYFKTVLLILLILNISTILGSCQRTDKDAIKAFELRIEGKTDEAKELLLNIIKADSTNAAAHFELARTLNYINIMGSKESAQALKSALKYDKDNIVYAFYNAKNSFLQAYIGMKTGGDNVKKLIDDVCKEFLKVLEMKPDYPEALMYLVEIYGMLPENMGGNKILAEEYTRKLEKLDEFYGAKARLVMMQEDTDMVEYWKNYITKHGEDCKVLKELGVACIFSDDIDSAEKQFVKAMVINKAQNIRLLDLARFHMMKVMQNRDLAKEELPKAKVFIEQYLASKPAPIPPLKAYAVGMMVKVEMFLGNKAESEKLMEEAKLLDPYFSRAFGIPALATFEPLDKEDHYFISFFSPF